MIEDFETRAGYMPKIASFEGCTAAVIRLREWECLDPAVEASRMDSLSGWDYFGLYGHAVLYRTGERAASERLREFLMFAAVLPERELNPAEARVVQRSLEGLALHMARSVAEQYNCDVAAALLEPTPADLSRIEDALASEPL